MAAQTPAPPPLAEVDTGSFAFSKAELMQMASDRAICAVDVYDGRGAAATQNGTYAYDGWANVHQGLIKRDMPWLPLLREHKNRKSVHGPTFSLAAPGGVAAARRLHEEAELCGHCTCGLVAKAAFAQRPMEEDDKGNRVRPSQLGLTADRSATVRQLMSDDAWVGWAAWERQVVEWEEREAAFQAELDEWREAKERWDAGERDDAPRGGAAAHAAAAAGQRGLVGVFIAPRIARARAGQRRRRRWRERAGSAPPRRRHRPAPPRRAKGWRLARAARSAWCSLRSTASVAAAAVAARRRQQVERTAAQAKRSSFLPSLTSMATVMMTRRRRKTRCCWWVPARVPLLLTSATAAVTTTTRRSCH